MSESETATEATATEAPEQTAERARRARTTYPIRVCLVEGASFTPVEAAGEFSEQRAADAWIVANGVRGQPYRTARLGPKVRPTVTLEEVT